MKDIHSKTRLLHGFGPVSLTADNTLVSIDLSGFEAAELVLGIGIGGITFDATNRIDFRLSHSMDDVTFEPVTIDDVLGIPSVGASGTIKSLVAAHAAAASYRYGYVGGRRYLRMLADFSGTHGAATPLYFGVLAGHPWVAPTLNQP